MASGLSSLTKAFTTGVNQIHLQKSLLYVPNSLKLPFRTTVILKRRVKLPVIKPDINPNFIAQKLEPLYQEYICVDDGKNKEYPNVKIVLLDIVEDVGKRGQIVEVEHHLAYDLVLLGKGLYATPENITKVQLLSASEIDKHSSLTAYKTMKMLKKKVLSVFMNMFEPWTIQPWHIRTNFRLDGVHISNEDCIELPQKPICGPNLDWEGKDFAIFITINNCERFPVRCRLRHFTKIYSKRIVLPPDHYCVPSEPIFLEQKELLDTIPLPVYQVEEKMA